MNLWNPWHRAMVMVAGASVLAACYAVNAWGQQGAAQTYSWTQGSGTEGSGTQTSGTQTSGTRTYATQGFASQTVTVASLRIPSAAWHHFEKAKNAAEHHRDGEFERESAKALEIAPAFAQMYLLRGTVQSTAHQFAAAAASAQAAAKADPGAMWTSVLLAGAYNGMHRFSDALVALDAMHGPDAETWQAVYERARAEIGLRDAAAALHWSGIALRVAPDGFGDAQLVRANALILADRLGDAVIQIDRYLQTAGPSVHRADVETLRDALRSRLPAAKPESAPQIGTQIGIAIGPHIASR